jgi:hypothetical protein
MMSKCLHKYFFLIFLVFKTKFHRRVRCICYFPSNLAQVWSKSLELLVCSTDNLIFAEKIWGLENRRKIPNDVTILSVIYSMLNAVVDWYMFSVIFYEKYPTTIEYSTVYKKDSSR